MCFSSKLPFPYNRTGVSRFKPFFFSDALLEFKNIGFVIIVSHDRWFLDRVCNKILALEQVPLSFSLSFAFRPESPWSNLDVWSRVEKDRMKEQANEP